MKTQIKKLNINLRPDAEVSTHTRPPRATSAGSAKGLFFSSYNVSSIRTFLSYTSNLILCYVRLVLALLIFTPIASASPVTGEASWYSIECCQFNKDPKCPTASGRSLYALEKEKVLFAAMWSLPLGSRVKVCNEDNGKCVEVTILDRGPAKRLHRKIDLSKAAFEKIADTKQGIINVSVVAL